MERPAAPAPVHGALLPVREQHGVRCFLYDRAHRELRATIELYGTKRLAARLFGESLTLADDLGRLLVVRLADGEVLRNLRL